MRAQFVRVGRRAFGGHHDRNDELAPFGIFRPDDHAFAYRRVLDEDIFDLGGGDVLPAANDRVVGAPADE
jgi:hypothetical protein